MIDSTKYFTNRQAAEDYIDYSQTDANWQIKFNECKGFWCYNYKTGEIIKDHKMLNLLYDFNLN